MKEKILILFIFCLQQVYFGQVSVVQETIEGSTNRLLLNIGKGYLINDYIDRAEREISDTPLIDLFVSVPVDEIPKLDFRIINSEKIEPKYLNENYGRGNLYTIRGFLWIKDQYCMHVSINPVFFNESDRSFHNISYLELTLTFKGRINDLSLETKKVTPAVLNKKFASGNPAAKKVRYTVTPKNDWIDFTSEYLKIGVADDGIYRITYQSLARMDVAVGMINPKTFRLQSRGVDIPIYVFGEEDDNFDTQDFIEFVGLRNMGGKHREINSLDKPYNEYLDLYSDTTVYWLSWGKAEGLRVQVDSVKTTPNADTLVYYDEIIHLEKNNWFDFSSPDLALRETPYWLGNKSWYEGQMYVGSRKINFNLTNVYSSSTFQVFVKFHSLASNISEKAHELAFQINTGTDYYDRSFINKYQQKVLFTKDDATLLFNGTNSITLRSFATEASVNSVNLDWYEMQYPRYIKPYSDSLVFSFSSINTEERKNVLVSGIQSDKISLWQIVPHNKKILVSSTGSSLVFSDTINSSSKYILLAENKIKEPKIFYKKIFTKTSDHSNQTDYILITHPNFISTGQNYADMIGSNYGLTTAVINIEDLYDEFNYGFFNPEVIKEFLKLTHQYWTKPAPQYVFLVGGTTYDYHDNKHKFMGYPKVNNFVPSYGASVSDNWFVIWDSTNANYLQMNIGRLPVTTSEEFERYLQRHISFLNQKYTDWNKKYILFSGGLGDNQSELDILRSANEFISTNLLEPPPIAGVYNHFYKTINPKSNFGPFSQSKVDEAIRNGAVFISYIGHSGTRTWDNSITEPEHLQNDFNRNPLVTDFGCSTARFAEPDVTSFAELFTVSNQSQAIVYIGNASLGFLSTATTFPKIFYSKLLKDSLHSVSDALNNSKHELVANYGNSTVNRLFVLTNTLIGDPIVNLQIPNKPNLVLKREDQKILLDNIDERSEYVNVKLIFNNYGSAPADSFRISVQDFYNSQNVFTLEDKLLIPGYIDSLIVNVPIKNKGGVHRLIVTLDSANEIEEIYEEDNILELEYFVPSIQLKTNLLYQYTTGIDKQFVLYSPITEPESNRVELEYANDAQFINKKKLFIQLDSVVTIVEFDSLEENKRYWIRYKYDNEERFSSSKSFVNSEHKYIANDSLGFSDFYLERLNNKNFLEAGEKEIKFEITSAGWDDGNVAVIQKDGVNYIPYWSTGHHACIFDKDNLEFAGYQTFNLLWGGTAAKNAYINFLDTLSSQYILVISVTDEGTVRYSEIRDKLKLFGSTKIDSVGFRDAWAFIGRKGAAAEEIHEMYKKHLNGPAKINTSYFRRYENGSFQSGLIGPAGSWSKLNLQFENYSDSSVFINVLARKASLDFDTLFYGAGNILDLTSIDASVYSHIKLDGRLNNRTDPPVIVNEISCDYALPAELLTNYQTVTVLYDSVFHGETNKLNFRIYNAGETAAADFTVNVDLLKPDNTIKQLNSFNSVSIDSMSFKKYEITFQVDSSDGEGQFYLAVNIDPEMKTTELFKDNNYYKIPITVKRDTNVVTVSVASLSVTYDGKDIYDGEYISPTPEITINLSYPSGFPINDTSSIEFVLDGESIPRSQLKISNDNGNRANTFLYKPQLKDGEHTLRIYGKNIYGNLETLPGYQKSFTVSNSLKIIDVYNYPNPFRYETHFTFKLTRVPEEVTINIYTVAGRLIRTIKLNESSLKYDFNKIYWDGRDEDGDTIANGVYFYKLAAKHDGKVESIISKLAIVR